MNDLTNLDEYLQKHPEYQKKMLKYLFQCILSEGSKIIVFSVFFLIWGYFMEFLAALIFLMLLRINGGGIHFKHYACCFLFSFAMLLGNILLAIWIPMPPLLMIALTPICAIAGYFMVPIPSSNRPPTTEAVIKKSKRYTLYIISGLYLLICRFPDNIFIRIGFWTIILHISQLFIAKIFKEV